MHANLNSAEEGKECGHPQAPKKDWNSVSICGTYAARYVVNAPTCATLIERVVGFMDRYNESWYG
jgi:hypothetical protein